MNLKYEGVNNMWKLCALYSGIQLCSSVAACKSETTWAHLQSATDMPHGFDPSSDTAGQLWVCFENVSDINLLAPELFF